MFIIVIDVYHRHKPIDIILINKYYVGFIAGFDVKTKGKTFNVCILILIFYYYLIPIREFIIINLPKAARGFTLFLI